MDANTTPLGCIQADEVGTVGVWAHTCSVVEVVLPKARILDGFDAKCTFGCSPVADVLLVAQICAYCAFVATYCILVGCDNEQTEILLRYDYAILCIHCRD